MGIQTFKDIRKEDFAYVDKTDRVHLLVSDGRSYFLNRPRGFGKTLFNRRDLFQ
ncbi:MAG: AAA family ATPase [Bacteroidales bacterium]|nr:AAA family ATPase [Bacteroidales bacterium]